MPTYAFRINCRLATCRFDPADSDFTLSLSGSGPVMVTTHNDTLVLNSRGYASEEDARGSGDLLKAATMLAGLLLEIGIDTGLDEIVSPAFRRADGTEDLRLQPEVHGLHVYQEVDRGSPFRVNERWQAVHFDVAHGVR